MVNYRLGIDLGGTSIKGGIIDKNGKVLYTNGIDTEAQKGVDHVIERIVMHIDDIISYNNLDKNEFDFVGVGSPGIVDDKKGVVIYSNNLNWNNVELVKNLTSKVGLPIKIANDANLAALGEVMYGSGQGLKNVILITLGTGIGGGIIIDGKIYSGNCGAGAELGHMVIVADGCMCTCGLQGCIESYASAKALTNRTKELLMKNLTSKMWTVINDIDSVSAKLAWDFFGIDEVADQLIKEYVKFLTIGLINYANIFRPQAILLGGGISYQGERLLKLIRDEFDRSILGQNLGPKVELRIAKLKNDAGFIGAACL